MASVIITVMAHVILHSRARENTLSLRHGAHRAPSTLSVVEKGHNSATMPNPTDARVQQIIDDDEFEEFDKVSACG